MTKTDELDIIKKTYDMMVEKAGHLRKILLINGYVLSNLILPEVTKSGNIDPSFIVNAVEDHFHVKISKKTRTRDVMEARHASAYLLSKYTTLSLSAIASLSGQKDHTSAIYSRDRCKDWMFTDENYRDSIIMIENLLQEQI